MEPLGLKNRVAHTLRRGHLEVNLYSFPHYQRAPSHLHLSNKLVYCYLVNIDILKFKKILHLPYIKHLRFIIVSINVMQFFDNHCS